MPDSLGAFDGRGLGLVEELERSLRACMNSCTRVDRVVPRYRLTCNRVKAFMVALDANHLDVWMTTAAGLSVPIHFLSCIAFQACAVWDL